MSDEQSFEGGDGAGGTGWSARNVRLLKGAVYIMGGLIVLGAIALVIAIILKSGHGGEQRAEGIGTVDVAAPTGATITASHLDGDHLAIDIASPQGPEVVIVDIRKGRVIGRVRLKATAP